MVVAFTSLGSAMGMLIARMAVTKTPLFVVSLILQMLLEPVITNYIYISHGGHQILNTFVLPLQTIDHAIQAQNSLARMADVFRKYGCAILTMTVATIATSQPTCVVKKIAPPVGSVVQVMPIIVVYLNGCSVMAKTIVAMVPTSFPRIVLSVILKWTSNAPIIGVCLNNGSAISLTIVGMAVMKLKPCARIAIENVQNLSSNVTMASALPPGGDAILKTIVAITVTRMAVKNSCAKEIHSSVQVATASHHI